MDELSREELGALIEENRGRMYRVAYAILRNGADADDAVSDATLRAFEKRTQLRKKGAAAGWIMKILVNASKNIIQKNARLELRDEFDADAVCAGGLSEDDADAVHRALSDLKKEYRECILLYYFYGYPVAGIAERLSVSEGTVKSRLCRGRRKLAELLRGTVLMIAFCFTLAGWLLAGRFAGEATLPRGGCGDVVLSGEADDAFGLENAETDDVQNVDGRNDAAGNLVAGNAGDGESDDIGGTIDATSNVTRNASIDATPDAASDARADTTTDATSNTATDKSDKPNKSREHTGDASGNVANNRSLWFSRSLSKSEQRRLRVLSEIGVDANDAAANTVVVISNTSEIDANAVCYLAAKNRVYLPTRTLTNDELKQILILTGVVNFASNETIAEMTDANTTDDETKENAEMSAIHSTGNAGYNQFYAGAESVPTYGAAAGKNNTTLVRYEVDTTDESGNVVRDKMSREETLAMVNEVSSQYNDGVIVEFSGDGLAALIEPKSVVLPEEHKEIPEGMITRFDAPKTLTDEELVKMNERHGDDTEALMKVADPAAYAEYKRVEAEGLADGTPEGMAAGMRYMIHWLVDRAEQNPNWIEEAKQDMTKQADDAAETPAVEACEPAVPDEIVPDEVSELLLNNADDGILTLFAEMEKASKAE